MTAKNGNLIINGSGSYPGGRYDKISIRGEGTIVNDVECSAFKVYGTSEVAESVKTVSVKVFGEAEAAHSTGSTAKLKGYNTVP